MFPHTTTLPHKVILYVPTNPDKGLTALHAAQTMCLIAGGCTVMHARGLWIDPHGAMIADSIALLHSAVSEANWPAMQARLPLLAQDVGAQLGQQAVSAEVDGVMLIFDIEQSRQAA